MTPPWKLSYLKPGEKGEYVEIRRRNGGGMIPDWLQTILRLMKPHIPPSFVGQLEINIFKGGITNINVKQSHKPERDTDF